jgi:hypothetical protein
VTFLPVDNTLSLDVKAAEETWDIKMTSVQVSMKPYVGYAIAQEPGPSQRDPCLTTADSGCRPFDCSGRRQRSALC